MHFTRKEYLSEIERKGLEPIIGINSQDSGKERYPRVYFTEGIVPTLEEFNHIIVKYIKFIDSMADNPDELYQNLKKYLGDNIIRNFSIEELKNISNENGKDTNIENEKSKKLAYKIMYHQFSDSVYLKLNLNGCKKEEYEKIQ